MNLSIIVPTPNNTYSIRTFRTKYTKKYDYEIEDCIEWSLVLYDFIGNIDILEQNIEKGEQLEIDMKLIIEDRLFSSNFEKYFENTKKLIITGLKKIVEKVKEKYEPKEILLLNKHKDMFERLNILSQSYVELKKMWWN